MHMDDRMIYNRRLNYMIPNRLEPRGIRQYSRVTLLAARALSVDNYSSVNNQTPISPGCACLLKFSKVRRHMSSLRFLEEEKIIRYDVLQVLEPRVKQLAILRA